MRARAQQVGDKITNEFASFTIKEIIANRHHLRYMLVCDSCHTERTAWRENFGKIKCYTCAQRDHKATGPKSHGHYRNKTKSLTYSSWNCMITRCYCEVHQMYPSYGGQGITVCDEWLHSFKQFVLDMGERPSSEHQLHRLDSSKGYGPDNCIWMRRDQHSIYHNLIRKQERDNGRN